MAYYKSSKKYIPHHHQQQLGVFLDLAAYAAGIQGE